MESESIKAFLFGMVKESGKSSEALPLPETPSMGDREHGGEADESGADEFPAQIEAVRGAWPDGTPMIAPDMPDWKSFCSGWYRDCFHCPYYDANPNSSPCALWEEAFPGVVRWYPPTC